MSAARSSVTLASGLTLSCARRGDLSGPALVLLPGPTDSWRSFAPVLGLLPSSVQVIAVSQRGHGDSDKPVCGYRVADFSDDVVELLDCLGIERAAVAGHSGSCLVARGVAIEHPTRVAGLVLEASPTTLSGLAVFEAFVASVVAGLADPIDPDFARSFVGDTSSNNLAPELLDDLVSELLKVPAHVWKQMFADLLTYDDTADLGSITAPTLLVWGDADPIVGRAMQQLQAEHIRGAQLLVYSGVGHTPRWENPCRFAKDVAAFAARLRWA